MAQRRSLGVVAGDGREIDVAGTILLVADVPLFVEDSQERADRRLARRLRQGGLNLGGRRVAALVKDVEDLALPAAQIPVLGGVHTCP